MAKKANPAPSSTCADCFHFSACHLWAVSISTEVAPQCPQFEPARYATLAELHEMHQMAKGDRVLVVRCRECTRRETDVCARNAVYCTEFDQFMPYNGFCHKGAKVDGGAE